MELEKKNISASACIEGALDLLASKAYEKGLELIYFNEHDVLFDGDETRLRQIIVNLVSNSVKFTSAGQIIVRATVYQPDDICQRLRVSVTDSGIGISQENVRKLFQSFTQAHSSVTRLYGGTGLGLAIVKRLCNLMGGDIFVETELGKGSTFTFEIRCHGCVESLMDIKPLEPIHGAYVLVQMSNPVHQELISVYCGQWGLNVILVNTREEALEKVKTDDRISFAMIDFELKGMKFVEEIRLIRDIPIIAFPPLGQNRNIDVLTVAKPIKKSKLYDTLVELVQQHRTRPVANARTKVTASGLGDLSDIRVLLCEDNPINQKVAIHILRNLKCTNVVVAENGKEGIDQLEHSAEPFDVILMDCQMPIMDGLEATKIIRSNDKWKNVRIIGLTANSSIDNRTECFACGMDAFIAKPFKIKDLYETIKSILNQNTQVDHK